MIGARTACVTMLALVGSRSVLGQAGAPADPETARIRTDFEYGKYPQALQRATSRIDRGNLSESDVIELHKYAGLSAFYLNKTPEAEAHLWALLQLDPDYTFDPFVVPPPAIAYLESLRKQRALQLDPIREQRRVRSERLKVEAEERERSRAEAELQRRRIEELSGQLRDAPLPRRSMILNFVPFGVGQFQQKRTKAGVLFAVSEGAFAATSIAAYLFYNSLIEDVPVTLDDRLTPDRTFTVTERGIPAQHQRRASVLRTVKYSSAVAFWLAYAIGVGDAIVHHHDHPLTSVATSDADGYSTEALVKRSHPSSDAPRAYVAPIDGGLSAGITFNF